VKSKNSGSSQLSVRLKEARETAGLSQSQAAKLLGLHRPTVSTIETGERKVSTDELKLFASIYKVSTEWLLDEINDSNSQLKIAARKLRGLKEKDLETVIRIIDSLRRSDG
jgi:transcriptional regulator with XRE-family HTH domain